MHEATRLSADFTRP